MTEFDRKLTSAELRKSAGKSDEHPARFLRPWQMDPDKNHSIWQQKDVHVCSCGCGCAKGKKLADRILKDVKQLTKELTSVKEFVEKLKKPAKKKRVVRRKLRKARRK